VSVVVAAASVDDFRVPDLEFREVESRNCLAWKSWPEASRGDVFQSSTQALTLGIHLGVLYMFTIMFEDSSCRPMSHYSKLSPEEQFRLDRVLFLSAFVARSDALLKQIPLKALDDHQEQGNECGLRLSIEI
jgi:hypothetical protein